MALQGPFFGKREEPTPPARNPAGSSLGGTSSLGSAGSASPLTTAAPVAAPVASSAPAAAAPVNEASSARLTVGPNIKLKGVEITDCDTVVIEGTVEATIHSRVLEIADPGVFTGDAEIDVAEIRGRFDGNLTARQKLTIFSTGKVTGKIRYGKIVIEEGGELSGDVTSNTSAGSGATTSSGSKAAKGEQLAVGA